MKNKEINGSTSDGYHTFDELYEFRKAYNACLFNLWAKLGVYDVNKSLRHSDGELCFGGGWFIVSAVTPFGLISNHYEESDWELFDCESSEASKHDYDGHTANDVKERLCLTASTKKTDGLSFGMAIEAAKRGCKISRSGWNGFGMYAYIVPANKYPAQTDLIKGVFEGDMVPYREYWALKTAQNDIATWSPSGSDSLANDWCIVE